MPWIKKVYCPPPVEKHKCTMPSEHWHGDGITEEPFGEPGYHRFMCAGSIWQCPGCPKQYELQYSKFWCHFWWKEYNGPKETS